jgi:hypothetical protein
MRPEDIFDWLQREPFVPSRIFTSNGRQFDVRRPEMAMVGRRSLLVGELDPDFPLPIYSRSTEISLLHINHIDPIEATVAPAG